jgi:hypothetical protein
LCKKDDIFQKRDWIIRFSGKLMGGVRHYTDRQLECYVIFTSMEVMLDIVKVDLSGYELDGEEGRMKQWIAYAAQMYIKCDIKLIEVVAPYHKRKYNYWKEMYKEFKHGRKDIID